MLVISGSNEKEKLTGALFMVISKIEPIIKNLTNDFLGAKYADLPTILEALKPILKSEGVMLQAMINSDSKEYVRITLRVTHVSGQWESFTSIFPAEKKPRSTDIQAVGASITYGIRYMIGSYFMIPFIEDDDGVGSNDKKKGGQNDIEKLKEKLIKKVNEKKNISPATKKQQLDWIKNTNSIAQLEEADRR